MSTAGEEWAALWRGIDELVTEFGDRLVFIGGVAVYLHVSHVAAPESFIEFSHDGDFLISLVDLGELRDVEEVTRNPRLNKYQITKHGIEFDVYAERQSHLLVGYEDAVEASTVIVMPAIEKGVRVASPEHLLVLKLDAYSDRKNSRKGEKDARDLVRIAYVLDHAKQIRVDLLRPYLTPKLLALLELMKKSPAFLQLSGKNAKRAQQLRAMFASVVNDITEAL